MVPATCVPWPFRSLKDGFVAVSAVYRSRTFPLPFRVGALFSMPESTTYTVTPFPSIDSYVS